MLLVLIGNNILNLLHNRYFFHMPLFFILELVYKNKDYKNKDYKFKDYKFKDFVKSKFKAIIILDFDLLLILYIIWMLLMQVQRVKILNTDISRKFIGIFYAQGSINYMWWGMQLGFLSLLFLIH